MDKPNLQNEQCRPRNGEADRVSDEEVLALLEALPGWQLEGQSLVRSFRFTNYEQTLAFVKHVAALAQAEDHHPEIDFGFNRCRVEWTTHSVDGLSRNDFICAAKTQPGTPPERTT